MKKLTMRIAIALEYLNNKLRKEGKNNVKLTYEWMSLKDKDIKDLGLYTFNEIQYIEDQYINNEIYKQPEYTELYKDDFVEGKYYVEHKGLIKYIREGEYELLDNDTDLSKVSDELIEKIFDLEGEWLKKIGLIKE